MKLNKGFIDATSLFLFFLFLYTGVSKYMDNGDFAIVLSDSPLLKPYAYIIATFLPGLEIVVALLLMVNRTRRLGLIISAGMLAGFTAYLMYMVSAHSNLPCSCGGIISSLSWEAHIVLNAVSLGASLLSLKMMKPNREEMAGSIINS